MKFFITGASGQLGRSFKKLLDEKGHPFVFYSHKTLDIKHSYELKRKLLKSKSEVLINCAAYNHVDLAEDNPPEAYLNNAFAVRKIAQICSELGIVFVHFSSDYIFNGQESHPNKEGDTPSPLNVYGRSKLMGEQFLMKTSGNYLLFRTSWVYGEGKQNFISKLLSLASKGETIRVSEDEVSVPTSSFLIAQVTLKALMMGLKGVYHLVPSGHCSRYHFALEVAKQLNLKNTIVPVSKKIFNLKAERGDFLVLDNTKLNNIFSLPSWKNDLSRFLKPS